MNVNFTKAHANGTDILFVPIYKKKVLSKAAEHINEKNGGAITRALQTHHNAVTHQLITTHRSDRCQIFDTISLCWLNKRQGQHQCAGNLLNKTIFH